MGIFKINPHTGQLDRVISDDELSGEFVDKPTYDIDENSIIDKAEMLDDGAGNTATSAEVKALIDNIIIDDTLENVLIGDGVVPVLTSGNQNVIMGNEAGVSITSSKSNVIIGFQAGAALVSNNNNTFIGKGAGQSYTGSNSVMIGGAAGNNSSGNNSVLVGNQAGQTATGTNVMLGHNAGQANLTTGCVMIGFQVGKSNLSGANKLGIHNSNSATPLIYGEFDNGLITINGDLNTTGDFTMKVYSQASKPTLDTDNKMAMWIDTSDLNRVYLVFRRGTGDQISVELA